MQLVPQGGSEKEPVGWAALLPTCSCRVSLGRSNWLLKVKMKSLFFEFERSKYSYGYT